MDLDFTKLAKQVYEQNKDLGHWDIDRPPAMIRLLILSEVFECFEACRKESYAQAGDLEWYLNTASDSDFCPWFRATIKHTVQEECADIIIRLLDYIGYSQVEKNRRWSPAGSGINNELEAFESVIFMVQLIGKSSYRDIAIRALEEALFLSGYVCNEDIMPYVHLKLRYSRIIGRDPQKKF